MNNQIIILAAGKGTRMNSDLPKVLVGLSGKPLVQHLLDNIKDIKPAYPSVIVVGYKYELVQSYLGANFIYAFQEGQFGTANAVAAAKSKVDGENVLVLYGDMPFIKPESLQKLIDLHTLQQSKFSMFTTTVPNFENEFKSHNGFGRILRGENKQLLAIREFVDATEQERKIKEVNPGVYMFDSNWLWTHIDQVKKNTRGEYYLTDLMEIAVRQNLPIVTADIDPMEVFGINTPEQLAQAEKMI